MKLDRIRRVAPAAVSLLLVLVVAGVGFAATSAASNRAQAVHIQDRSEEQATLAGLGTQYVLFGFKEEANFVGSHQWTLRSGDASDVAQLQEYSGQSALLGYGSALVDLDTDNYISQYAPSTGLPSPSNPGMAPLLDSLRGNGPGLSSVTYVGSISLVAYGVTFTTAGKQVGFVGFSNLAQSPLESYVEHLSLGKGADNYVVDSHGVAIAAGDPAEVGKHLNATAPLAGLTTGKNGYVEFSSPSGLQIATYDPIGLGGWGSTTIQSASEFFGPIRSGILRVEGALALILVVAGVLIAVFIHRRQVGLRREMRVVKELAEARERFRHAFEETPVGMALIDVQPGSKGKFLQANQALCRLTGLSVTELLQLRVDDLVHPDNLEKVRNWSERLLSGDTSFEFEIRLATNTGGWTWVLLHGSLIRDASGLPLYGVAHIEDISGRKAAEDRLAHMALHDPLTGLANRVLIAERLTRALAVASRYGTQVGVLYLDLDNFKEINDRYGHETGDRVLQAVAVRLQMAVRPEDTPGRLGGDEFVVVCEGLGGVEAAMTVAERIEAAITAPIEVDGEIFVVRVSTGISIGGGTDAYADQLLRDADAAMYMAKKNGRGHVRMAAAPAD